MTDSKGRMVCAARVGDTIIIAEVIKTVHHIFQTLIDYSQETSEVVAYKNALAVFNYALENNLESLNEIIYKVKMI